MKYSVDNLSHNELYELWVLLRFAYKNPCASQTEDMETINETYHKVLKALSLANGGK